MKKLTLLFVAALLLYACSEDNAIPVVNIGYVGPLTTRATDLGKGPANAMRLAVEQYNENREAGAPLVNFYTEDDRWEKENAIPAYDRLREQHNIDVIFISNTDGTVAIQDKVLNDGVILINPLNNDNLLATMNKNTFTIAKATEDANGIIGIRIVELGLKKVLVMHYPNDFMTRATNAVKEILEEEQIESKVVTTPIGKTDFEEALKTYQADGYDAYVFFGYKEFGFAMKQARELGIKAPFFGSTVLLDPAFYENSEGAIIGTECTFFMPADGNYVLARDFLKAYEDRYGGPPASVWPPMQAYDAINLTLQQLKNVNDRENTKAPLVDWLREKLHEVKRYQGVCGNISIGEDGTSKGIYFSLYRYESKGKLSKVKR